MSSMIGSLLGSFSSWSRLTGASDDDWIDRVNHIWTVVLLVIFAIVVSSGQYVGNPIECWMPAEFTGSFTAYAKSYCWISNTYYVPLEDTIPQNISTRQDKEITYYQWVPLILMFQAFLFKWPNVMWRMLNGYSGINLDKICTMAESSLMSPPAERLQSISHLAKYMNRWIETHREYHHNFFVKIRQKVSNVFCFCVGKRDGTYLTGFYLFIKALYCANVVGQFFLLNAFMATDYNMFGFEVIDHLTSDGEWKDSPRFPRVTLCDFQIRQLANLQRFTVQCVLPINLFNEKIFIFLWFWLFFVAFLSFFNLFQWLYYILFSQNRVNYCRKFLKISNELNTGFDKKLSRKFADHYLRDDGVFVLRVIGKNSSDMVLTDLVQSLWKVFKEEHCSVNKESIDVAPVPETPRMNGHVSKETLM